MHRAELALLGLSGVAGLSLVLAWAAREQLGALLQRTKPSRALTWAALLFFVLGGWGLFTMGAVAVNESEALSKHGDLHPLEVINLEPVSIFLFSLGLTLMIFLAIVYGGVFDFSARSEEHLHTAFTAMILLSVIHLGIGVYMLGCISQNGVDIHVGSRWSNSTFHNADTPRQWNATVVRRLEDYFDCSGYETSYELDIYGFQKRPCREPILAYLQRYTTLGAIVMSIGGVELAVSLLLCAAYGDRVRKDAYYRRFGGGKRDGKPGGEAREEEVAGDGDDEVVTLLHEEQRPLLGDVPLNAPASAEGTDSVVRDRSQLLRWQTT